MSKKVKAEDFENFARDLTNVLTIMGADLMKVQKLLYALLSEQGYVDERVCPHCKEELMIPNLPTIEKSDTCPACGKNIYEGTQTTFESWDAGGEEE